MSNGNIETIEGKIPVSESESDSNSIVGVDIKLGAKSAEITIELDPGLSVSGKTVDADEKETVGTSATGLLPGTRDFEPLSSAKFEIRALRVGEKRRAIFLDQEKKRAGTVVVAGGQTEPAIVKLEPWGEAFGRFVDESGKPVSETWLTLADVPCEIVYSLALPP